MAKFVGFCWNKGCGRLLSEDDEGRAYCKKHKYNIDEEARTRVGKWSGYSKNYGGFQNTRRVRDGEVQK